MANQVTNYQCPNCLAGLRFDGQSGQLACDSCDNMFDVATVEQLYADNAQAAASAGVEPQWDISMTNNFSAEEAAYMRGYSCPSCAAEIICEYTTAATSCPYCGNPTVIPGQFSAQLKPDYIVPFKLDKKAATDALKQYYKGKKFLPKSFADTNHIEDIKGVYVPFWLYDGETDAYMRFRATKSRTFRRGDYRITETDHYRVTREGSVSFRMVPADGSSKMPDAHMDSIEPYDYREIKPFAMGYLPGFLADKYDVDAETCSVRANERIVTSTENALRSTITGYTTVTREYSNVNLKRGDVKYALMPVWLLSSKWKDKSFLFAMNGQTGKLIGDLPVDRGKFWAWFFGIAAPLAAILAVIVYVL
ncbi:MAG: hypothetical protein FWH33_01125 [Oscillospiraceae bacterium]|nr:hypothetical protein [Oscillospiraceae bacterium]